MGVTEILCSFKWVLGWKTGKYTWVIKIRVLRKVLSKQFCFIRCRTQQLWSMEKRRYSRFIFVENTIDNSPKITTAKFLGRMDSFVLLAYESLATLRTLLQWLLACLNFTLELEDLSFWYKQKKLISMDYGHSTISWKTWRWMRFDLIFFIGDI